MGSELRQAFGEVIRELRQDRNLSQEELSFSCGRHRTYVSLLERGRNTPTIETVWRIAEALEVSAVDLIAAVQERLDGGAERRRRRTR